MGRAGPRASLGLASGLDDPAIVGRIRDQSGRTIAVAQIDIEIVHHGLNSVRSEMRISSWHRSSVKPVQTSILGRSGLPSELTARNPESNGFSIRKKPVSSLL